jgi:hypothetical protein
VRLASESYKYINRAWTAILALTKEFAFYIKEKYDPRGTGTSRNR